MEKITNKTVMTGQIEAFGLKIPVKYEEEDGVKYPNFIGQVPMLMEGDEPNSGQAWCFVRGFEFALDRGYEISQLLGRVKGAADEAMQHHRVGGEEFLQLPPFSKKNKLVVIVAVVPGDEDEAPETI